MDCVTGVWGWEASPPRSHSRHSLRYLVLRLQGSWQPQARLIHHELRVN